MKLQYVKNYRRTVTLSSRLSYHMIVDKSPYAGVVISCRQVMISFSLIAERMLSNVLSIFLASVSTHG